MILEMERHSGVCGHCHTDVPTQANVCTGCGAKWGLSTGRTRQQEVDEYLGSYKLSKFLMLTVIIALLVAVTSNIGIFLPGGYALVIGWIFIKSWACIKRAKTGQVSWWR